MRRIVWISLCFLALCLAACATSSGQAVYKPAPSDVSLEEWAARYPQEYNSWKDSVHGSAYLAGKQDAPGCTDCHQDPATGEIATAAFHLDIPARCARCHSDAAKMSQYNITADVYATYLADYHGKTIAYYAATGGPSGPTARRYEAVCSDCHGSHAVYAPDDPRSSMAPAHLLATCQQCHAGASVNFTAATGHYRSALDPVTRADAPLVFWVKLVYQSMIPVIIGLMMVYIGLDVTYRVRKQRRERRSHDQHRT